MERRRLWGLDQSDNYYFIQYTKEECEKNFNGKPPIWGRPQIEGIILCKQLHLEGLCFIEIIEDPETTKPVLSFYLAAKDTYQNIREEEAQVWIKNPNIPTLVIEQNSLHFVPLLKAKPYSETPLTQFSERSQEKLKMKYIRSYLESEYRYLFKTASTVGGEIPKELTNFVKFCEEEYGITDIDEKDEFSIGRIDVDLEEIVILKNTRTRKIIFEGGKEEVIEFFPVLKQKIKEHSDFFRALLENFKESGQAIISIVAPIGNAFLLDSFLKNIDALWPKSKIKIIAHSDCMDEIHDYLCITKGYNTFFASNKRTNNRVKRRLLKEEINEIKGISAILNQIDRQKKINELFNKYLDINSLFLIKLLFIEVGKGNPPIIKHDFAFGLI